MSEKKPKTALYVRMPPVLYERLRRYADGESMAAVVRQAIREYLDRNNA